MTGKIKGISGPTVSVDLKGLKLYEKVCVGHSMLTGEVVRIEQDRAVIQTYEDTKGLSINEPVKATGTPLTVRLGPGLLSEMFDGLQRPLSRLREETGPFIKASKDICALDYQRRWRFHPLKDKGAEIKSGEIIGYVEEGRFRHFIMGSNNGRVSSIADGDFTLNEPLVELEGGSKIFGCYEWSVRIPRPCKKKFSPSEPLITGQRAMDFLFPLARGGTAVLPGGFGTGKTILEQSIAKFAGIDIVVYVGCGERGNEMAELIEDFATLTDPWTGKRLMERMILVVNTSNMPVAARESSIYTAVTMAEYYGDMGYHVLLLADSISRWAEALREISSSLEEMPGEEGYPTYLASRLSNFFERAGVVETLSGKTGSLSMILSVSPPGGDFTEPVTQACLRSAGASLMLDASLAHKRHFPAINWFQSYSLYEKAISRHFIARISKKWDELRQRCKEILQRESALKEIAGIVGMEGLQDSDRLLMHAAEKVRMEFLCQNAYTEDAFSPPEKTVLKIEEIVEFYDNVQRMLKEGMPLDEILKMQE
ncbi:MAG: V-type ATP synthase subunit A [Thermodesulfovibrionales bacterium]|nr:V-type ATP synthase subunit A [Thermodesulfovibrionales bacterium]